MAKTKAKVVRKDPVAKSLRLFKRKAVAQKRRYNRQQEKKVR